MQTKEEIEGPRECNFEYEIGPTLDTLNLVMRLSGGAKPNYGESWPYVFSYSNRKNIRIIKIGGKVVSCVSIFPSEVTIGEITLKVGGINGLATHPEYRKRGYAKLILEDAIQRMQEENCDISLVIAGVPEYYRRFDWEKGGRENTYFLDRGNINLLPKLKNCQIQECFGDKYLNQISILRDKEYLGTVRSKILFRLLLNKGKTYLSLKEKNLVAYIVVIGRSVVEHAGPPEIVSDLIRKVFYQMDKRGASTTDRDKSFKPVLEATLSVNTPGFRVGLSALLDDLRIPKRTDYLGMIRIINIRSLLKKLGLDDIRVEENLDKINLYQEKKNNEFTRRELVKLIFGPERVSNFRKDIFPINFYQWPLDRV